MAAVIVILSAGELQAQPQLQNTREIIEIRADAWTLRYGRANSDGRLFNSASEDRVYFTHGGWLRVIDARKGVVVNRWHFPGEIVKVAEKGDLLEIMLNDGLLWVQTRTLSFDLRKPEVPYWPTNSLLWQRVSLGEIEAFVRNVTDTTRKPEESREAAPRLEEAVRRDPTSAWLWIAWGAVLREIGDARASRILSEAVALESTDFTELLSISGSLDVIGEKDLAREAFERGYRDFLAKGNHPRALASLLGRLMLYRRDQLPPYPWASQDGREQMDRLYRLAPLVEGSQFAWRIYAENLASAGLNDEARLFETRAAESDRATSISAPLLRPFTIERLLLLFCAAIAAALAYLIVLTSRYGPEHRLRTAAETRSDSAAPRRWIPSSRKRSVFAVVLWFAASYVFFSRVQPRDVPESVEPVIVAVWILVSLPAIGYLLALLPSIGNRPWKSFGYWSSRERKIFAALVVIGWLAFGIAGPLVEGLVRNVTLPLSPGLGSFAGPTTIAFFEERLPASPERDLMLAIAYQQDRQSAKAEALYRTIPQFAESWNNLGVVLKERGAQSEADAAFDHALALDPTLEEARLNRGLSTTSFWTQQHRLYFPGQAMIALPQPEHVRRVLLGRSVPGILVSGAFGPFAWLPLQHLDLFDGPSRSSRSPIRSWSVIGWLLVPLLVLAILALFARRHDVTQPPAKYQWVLEAVVAGSDRRWHYLSILALIAWIYSVLQLLFFKSQTWLGSPFTYFPSVGRPFGVPFDTPDLQRFTHPSDVWIYGLPIVLFVLNFVVVGISANYKYYKK